MTHAHVDNRPHDQADWPEVIEGLFTGHRLAPDECITGESFDGDDQLHLFNIGNNDGPSLTLGWVRIRLALTASPPGTIRFSLYLVETSMNRTIDMCYRELDPNHWLASSRPEPLKFSCDLEMNRVLSAEHRYLLHFTSTDNALIKGQVECLISTN